MMVDSPSSLYDCCLVNIADHLNFILNWNGDSLSDDDFDDDQLLSRLKLFLKFNSQQHNAAISGNFHGRFLPGSSVGPDELVNNCPQISRHYDDKLRALKQSCHKFVSTYILGKKAITADNSSSCDNNNNNNSEQNRLSISNINGLSNGNSHESSHNPDDDSLKLASYFRLCNTVCEDIFNCFQQKYPITDSFLNLSIFQGGINQIGQVNIKDASKLTFGGLKVLQCHNVNQLRVSHLAQCNVNQLIDCLSPWSKQHLQSFGVSHCQFSSVSKVCLVISLTGLKSLRSLDVSYTDFNNHGLEIIVEDLPNLDTLNISSTKVTALSSLLAYRHRFTRLYLNNLNWASQDEHILTQMTNLTHLEISEDKIFVHRTYSDPLFSFLKDFSNCPRLVELDISGRDGIDVPTLRQMVIHKRQQASLNANSMPLEFIGLMQTNFNHDDIEDLERISDNELTITGDGNLQNIFESLKRYKDRPNFIQKSLYYLYNYTHHNEDQHNNQRIKSKLSEHRSELVLLVVELFQRYFPSLNVALVSTACLYNLTKNTYSEELHPHVLKKVADIALEVIDIHHNNQQLMKNILLILCSDRILQEASFDRIKCVRLVMDSLIKFRDIHLNRLALAICSVLFAKISTDEVSLACHITKYMKQLLCFVEEYKCDSTETGGMMLKLTLSVLWNFTDESPKTCKVFIELDGLKIYLNTLRLFQGTSSVETKILGLLNNIAEVRELRHHLLDSELLFNLKNLIYSKQIDISYFSAGIIAQLFSEQLDVQNCDSNIDTQALLDNMTQVMLSWKTPNFEMVAYRSFGPFKKLLVCHDYMAVQLWALWAIHHVCTMNPPKYCQLLYEDHCLAFIVNINDRQLEKNTNNITDSDRISLRERLQELATFECYSSSGSGSEVPQSSSECANSSNSSNDSGCEMVSGTVAALSNVIDHLMSEDEEDNDDIYFQSNGQFRKDEEVTMDYITNTSVEIEPKLTPTSSECRLRHQLSQDPLLCLSTLILKTFQSNCPVLLKNFYYNGCCNS